MTDTYRTQRQARWAAIEAEYGETAEAVVRGMREQGVSVHQIALTLDLPPRTLYRWCRRWGMETTRSGWHHVECEGHVQRRARALGYVTVGEAIAALRAQGLSRAAIRDALGCGEATYSRHMPRHIKYDYYCWSEAGRSARTERNRHLARRPPDNHPWRR